MTRFAVITIALAAAGCATSGDTQVATADCKVVPMTTASAAGRAPRNVDPLEQRYAQMQLANTEFRRRQLHERGTFDSTVEEALRDCARR